MPGYDGFTEEMWRGDTHRFRFIVKLYDPALDPALHSELDPTSDPMVVQDITDWEKFWLTVKRRIKDEDDDALIALDDATVGGILRSDLANGVCTVTFQPEHTADLSPSSRPRTFFVDIQGKDSLGDVYTLLGGELIITTDTTVRVA